MNNCKEKIYDILCGFAVLFNAQPSKDQLIAYAKRLSRYSPDALLKTFLKLEKTCRRFPSLAEIYEIIDPEMSRKDEANELAGEIISCISIYGYTAQDQVKKAVGKVGWFAIERFGGWGELCKTSIGDLSMVRAQLRDMCTMSITLEKSKGKEALTISYTERQTMDLNLAKIHITSTTGRENVSSNT